MSEPEPLKLEYATRHTPTGRHQLLSDFIHGRFAPWMSVIGGVTTLLLLAVSTAPSPGLGRGTLAALLGIATTGIWITMVAARFADRLHHGSDPHRPRVGRIALWLCPILLLLSLVALRYSAGPRLAAWVSTSAAQRLAQQPTTAPMPAPLVDQRIGVFRARDVERIPGGVTFTIGTSGLFGVYGYCYTEAGNPRPPSHWQSRATLHPLGGGWWIWEWQD